MRADVRKVDGKGFANVALAIGALSAIFAGGARAASSQFAADVQSDSPYAYFRFNEASGTTLTDSSGNGHNGAYGAAYSTTTVLNQMGTTAAGDHAVAFNNSTTTANNTQLASVSAAAIGGFAPSLASSSYEFVFKSNAGFNSTQTNGQPIFSVSNGSGGTDKSSISITLSQNSAAVASSTYGNIFIRNASGTNGRIQFPQASLTDGNYHDFLFTYGGNMNATIYVDGTALPNASLTFSNAFSSFSQSSNAAFINPLTIANSNTTTYAGFTLDEAAFYPSVLSASDAETHAFDAGVPEPTTASLIVTGLAALSLRRRRRSA